MAICSLFISFLENACSLCYVPTHLSDFVLVGPNFKFECTRSQLALTEPLFASVNSSADPADPADPTDPLVDPLTLQFDLHVPNFSCFGKLTTMFFFMSLMFLALSSKFLISV